MPVTATSAEFRIRRLHSQCADLRRQLNDLGRDEERGASTAPERRELTDRFERDLAEIDRLIAKTARIGSDFAAAARTLRNGGSPDTTQARSAAALAAQVDTPRPDLAALCETASQRAVDAVRWARDALAKGQAEVESVRALATLTDALSKHGWAKDHPSVRDARSAYHRHINIVRKSAR